MTAHATAAGLALDIVGALVLARGVLSQSPDEYLRARKEQASVGALSGIDPAGDFASAQQRADTKVGVALLVVGFIGQLLDAIWPATVPAALVYPLALMVLGMAAIARHSLMRDELEARFHARMKSGIDDSSLDWVYAEYSERAPSQGIALSTIDRWAREAGIEPNPVAIAGQASPDTAAAATSHASSTVSPSPPAKPRRSDASGRRPGKFWWLQADAHVPAPTSPLLVLLLAPVVLVSEVELSRHADPFGVIGIDLIYLSAFLLAPQLIHDTFIAQLEKRWAESRWVDNAQLLGRTTRRLIMAGAAAGFVCALLATLLLVGSMLFGPSVLLVDAFAVTGTVALLLGIPLGITTLILAWGARRRLERGETSEPITLVSFFERARTDPLRNRLLGLALFLLVLGTCAQLVSTPSS